MTTRASKASTGTRIILGAAALVALAAVGISVTRQGSQSLPEAAAGPDPESENPEAMITRLEAKLKLDPNDATGWSALGAAFFRIDKFAESATAYARAVKIDPRNPDFWSAFGEARVLAGPGVIPAEAKQAFERALTLDPKDPRARYFLGVAQDLAGDHNGAIEAWLALLADTPRGAPWEQDVQQLILVVGAKEKIEVASRLAALKRQAPSDGAAIATAAIPGPSRQQMQAAAQMPKGQQDAMIQSMVDGLEAKLKANPRNVQGWIMLMRSRMSVGEPAKAASAYVAARTTFSGDAATLRQIDEAANSLGVR